MNGKSLSLRTRVLGLLSSVVALCGVGLYAVSAQASPSHSNTHLAQAVQNQGVAAGAVPLGIGKTVKVIGSGVNADAAGVNAGTKVIGPHIVMHAVSPAQGKAQAAQAYNPGDATAGCLAGYGVKLNECLGLVSPDEQAMGPMDTMKMPWRCSQVRLQFPHGLPLDVKGVDPQHLDTNHDGVACGKGD